VVITVAYREPREEPKGLFLRPEKEVSSVAKKAKDKDAKDKKKDTKKEK
jgi:hypothetical protein